MSIAAALHLDLTAPKHTAVKEFINSKEAGEVTFTNDNGETYTLIRREDLHLRLTFPEGNYTGDPAVVERFNALNYAPLNVNEFD